MRSRFYRTGVPLAAALLLAGCGGGDGGAADAPAAEDAAPAAGEHGAEEGRLVLSAAQIADAGIRLGRPILGGGGAIDLPATIEGDPQALHVVSAAIEGRVAGLTRELGQSVGRGQTLAVIESREAALLKGEVEAARARLALADANLAREQRLFDERVTPEQDLIAARTAATEARIAYRQARAQVAAAGGGGGGLNRLGIPAPIAGQVIARPAVLGQTVAAGAELYRIADLSRVGLSFNLQPADAARVRPGDGVTVSAAGRQAEGRIRFVSPALDPDTRLVPALATLDNRGGLWRIGEPVRAGVRLAGGGDTVRVPAAAIQTVEGGAVVFVRTREGFRAAPVTTGDRAGDMVVVTAGLSGGETIATEGSFVLKAELGKSEAGHED